MWKFLGRRDVDGNRLELVEARVAKLKADLRALADKHEAFVADIFRIDEEADEIEKARDIQIENIEAAIRNHADAIEQIRATQKDTSDAAMAAAMKVLAQTTEVARDLVDLKAQMRGLSGEHESFKKTAITGLELSRQGDHADDGYAYKDRLDQIEQRSKLAEGQAKKGKLVDLPPDDGDLAAGLVPLSSGPRPFPPAQGEAEASLASAFDTPPVCFAEDN